MVGPGEEILIKAMNTLLGHITQGRTAPIHDHIKGRTSEMEFIPGAVSKRGRELGIATPFNDAIVEIDRMINKGQIKMSPDNFKLLQEKVGMQPKA
jgi:2-dehydropantoate 2-reductase